MTDITAVQIQGAPLWTDSPAPKCKLPVPSLPSLDSYLVLRLCAERLPRRRVKFRDPRIKSLAFGLN